MAQTTFAVNDPLAINLWSKKLSYEAIQATKLSSFVGKTSDSMIVVKDEAQKSAGAKITFGLRMQLKSAGVKGEEQLEGNEEKLVFRNDNLAIDQLRNAVLNVGAVSQQRVPFDLREEAKSGLVDWWADRLDAAMMNQLAGNTSQSDVRFTGMNGVSAPTSTAFIVSRAGGTTEVGTVGNSLDSREGDLVVAPTATLSLADLTRARILAETRPLPIRPITVGSQKLYVCFLHPFQAQSLKQATSGATWYDIQKAAMQGGQINDNPIFTGAMGMYDGIVLHIDQRVPWGATLAQSASGSDRARSDTSLNKVNVARAVLCGSQAGMLAFGRDSGWPFRMKWVEDLRDYENQLGVSAAMVYGMKKTTFKDENNSNGIDFGAITISSYAAV